jgi:hypothetical protein
MSYNNVKIEKLDLAVLLESAYNLKAVLSEIDESGRINKNDILNILTDGNPICECCGDFLRLEDVKECYLSKLDNTLNQITNK